MQTLIQWLPLYDDNGWSYYQLAARKGERHYASIFYHYTHIAQLNVFAAMTGCEQFRVFADRWRTGLNRVDVRRRVWKDSAKWLAQSVRRRVRTPRHGRERSRCK
jgi:D-glucuronyl C5-epimerase C-terminus